MYAVVETGGKQYRVTPGQVIDIDRIDVNEGDTVELDKVLVVGDDEKVAVGTPTIDGAKVMATSQGEGRYKKVIVFRYKPKVRYSKKTGHRQYYTRLTIDKIITLENAQDEPAKKVRRRKKEETDDGA